MGCPWWQSDCFVSDKDIGEGNNGQVRGWDKFSLSQDVLKEAADGEYYRGVCISERHKE